MCNGIEIDMLSLGDADCILVSFWNGLSVYRVLIDGGNKGDAPAVRAFLRGLKIETIDDVLSTHLHDDHSGGLIELLADKTLTFGKLWCHVPHWHVESMDKVWAALKAAGSTSDEAANIRKSIETVASLYNTAKDRGIAHEEPFKGKLLGKLEVCSPTVEFYNGLVVEMTDVEKIKAEDAAEVRYDVQTALEEAMSKNVIGALSGSSLLSDPHTTPENESSVVTGANHDGKVMLFTADAGTCALTNVVSSYKVKDLHWMQIPHHGSRRNVTESLIETFKPTIAYVSAAGNDKHPRRAVVNAFKKVGSRVYSTHYPSSGHLRYYVGTVPTRTGYDSATPLWDEKKQQLSKQMEPDWSRLAALLGGSG
jgi:beta-lactamase superfamily II metal-dependent hydrolase